MKTRILKSIVMIVAAIAVVAVAAGVQAQTYSYGTRGHPRWYGPGQHHASTYAEGVQRGWASVIRAMGDYNYWTSEALINREEARRMYTENRDEYVQQYFELRRLNREARAAERGPKPTPQDVARFAKDRAPNRLSAYEYEISWGELKWPSALADEQFDVEREVINDLMKQRSVYNSGAGTDNHRQIVELSNRMLETLRGQIDEVAPMEYVAARSFLKRLQYESRFVPELSAVTTPTANLLAMK